MPLDITVCIPLNDPENRNEQFLRAALDSLVNQTARPSQVVMTSSTEIPYVSQICLDYMDFFEVIYRVKETNGASMNFNNCVSLASQPIIQLLCQDDFLKSPRHLARAYKKLIRSEKKWLISGCRHFEEIHSRFDRRIRPKYSIELITGSNTIGAPSVVTFYREAFVLFDTRLHFMYDCDWYVRMFHNWGKPIVSRRDAIGIRIHENQSTNEVSGLLEVEIRKTAESHSGANGDICKCVLNIGNKD